jgi:hypothetical protein
LLCLLLATNLWAKGKTLLDYRSELQLSDTQYRVTEQLLKNFKSELLRLQQALSSQEVTFRKLVSNQAELTEIRQQLQSIQQTRIALRMLDISTARELEANLTVEQRNKWSEIQKASQK